MTEVDFGAYFLIGLIVLGIILFAIPEDLFAQAKETFRGEFLITPVEAKPKATTINTNGAVSGYNINFIAKLAYLNPESLGASKLDSSGNMEVMPIVSFKGGSGRGKPFSLSKEKMINNEEDHDKSLAFMVNTKEKLFERIDSSLVERDVAIEEGFILTSDDNGNFLVKSEQYGEFLGRCKLTFKVQCGVEIKTMQIDEGDDCIESKTSISCVENLNACGGGVEIEMPEKPDCEAEHNMMSIRVRGGIEKDLEKESFEEVYISFWKNSDCIAEETNYNRLVGLCGLDKLSGLYKYPIHSIA